MLNTVLNPGDYLLAAEPEPADDQETSRDEYDAPGQLAVDLEQALSAAGFAAALERVPYVLFSLPAGALVDRWDRKRIMIICTLGLG
jgi:MFS family permease